MCANAEGVAVAHLPFPLQFSPTPHPPTWRNLLLRPRPPPPPFCAAPLRKGLHTKIYQRLSVLERSLCGVVNAECFFFKKREGGEYLPSASLWTWAVFVRPPLGLAIRGAFSTG